MKIKCTFHIAIAFILIQLTDEFSIAFAYGICEKNPYVRILYVTFAILSLLTMIYLYTKYIIRIQMQDLFLGMPLPKKKWCITAVLMPVLICLFYIFFTKGTFEKGNLTYKEIIDVVTISILSSGIKAAVTEEIVFRGMILRLLQNTFGKKCAVFVSSFLFAVYHFDGIDYDEKTHRNTIFLFDQKSWDQEVDDENGNYDYLMGADLDFGNEETVQEETAGTTEGKRTVYYTTKYERSSKNREAAIRIHGTKCMICGFDFGQKYGELGKGYIEVHHIKPLATLEQEVVINPETDLICVCANCHRMLHRFKNYIVTVEELKYIVDDNK